MDALKAEMERKRKEREAASGADGSGKKKWVKRGDIEKVRAVHPPEVCPPEAS